ncbi:MULTISPECIES: ABC transporter permease [Roseomonadaceae]|uniref:ABC transporter permease n=1 Tax=Falsiroseomonas oleicola TaxID=2801474 RepID=A0ABS6H4E8_9PROT|nr:ABC transporter permease [Roseomonas oleicola]MBU8543541.1 ABC transporter permease [Roseomonas oleicola]
MSLSATAPRRATAARPEREEAPIAASAITEPVVRPLPFAQRLAAQGWFRRAIVLVCIAALWELNARLYDNPLLFPSFGETAAALLRLMLDGTLPDRIGTSLEILLMGYAVGILLAAVLTSLAIGSRWGADLLSTLTAMFNPLPAIALLPLALMWFGLGSGSIIFVIVHSVLWAVALNTLAGFRAVPDAQRMAGQNYGLRGIRYVLLILVPAALPSIVSGLKIGWAFAWRTLIAAELVFGVSAGSGGLGWFIFERRNSLETAEVFAGLMAVIVIGLLMEGVVFRTLEARTVVRWGMQR